MVRSEPWARQHTPASPAHVVGHAKTAERIIAYLATYRRGTAPLFLVGPTGIGKTCLVQAIAAAEDRELLEVNASDDRGKEAITATVGQAAFQATLFQRPRLILIDEVDGISGTSDRGGIPTLLDICSRSTHPIILTANDLEADKLKPLRKACEVIEMAPPDLAEIAALLARIGKAEGLTVAPEAAMSIARRSGGDVRAAITDLQSIAHEASVTKEAVDAIAARDTTGAIEDGVALVLRTTSAHIALPAFETVNSEPQEILHWMDENVSRAYKSPADLARAQDALSRADIFLGRIRRWQHYRFYVYASAFLTAGVATAKDGKLSGALTPKRPQRFLKLWIAKQRMAKRDALATALAPALHTSAKRARQDILPYLRYAGKRRGTAWSKTIAAEYGLDPETTAWLSKE